MSPKHLHHVSSRSLKNRLLFPRDLSQWQLVLDGSCPIALPSPGESRPLWLARSLSTNPETQSRYHLVAEIDSEVLWPLQMHLALQLEKNKLSTCRFVENGSTNLY